MDPAEEAGGALVRSRPPSAPSSSSANVATAAATIATPAAATAAAAESPDRRIASLSEGGGIESMLSSADAGPPEPTPPTLATVGRSRDNRRRVEGEVVSAVVLSVKMSSRRRIEIEEPPQPHLGATGAPTPPSTPPPRRRRLPSPPPP